MPSAMSRASDPVETAPIETCGRSLIFMTDPLPNWRSIWPSVVSSLFAIHRYQPPKGTDSNTSYRAPPRASTEW